MHRTVFEVERYCLRDIGTKFFPCLAFGEDAMAECARAIATFLSAADFEDQLHTHRIPAGEGDDIPDVSALVQPYLPSPPSTISPDALPAASWNTFVKNSRAPGEQPMCRPSMPSSTKPR